MKSTKGKYIVLEGIQGVGKTTQAQILADHMRSTGMPVHITREPGGADLTARAVRAITQNPMYPIDTKTEVLLYNAARARSLEVIRALLARGVWVISDRNFLTTLAIQYYARNDDTISYKDITAICEFAVGDMMPDMTLVLDLPINKAMERVSDRQQGERYDSLKADFTQRMRDGFLKEAEKRDYPVLSADATEEKVAANIWKHIELLLR